MCVNHSFNNNNETNVNRAISGPKRTISLARGNTPPEHSSSGASVFSFKPSKDVQNHKHPSYKRRHIHGTAKIINLELLSHDDAKYKLYKLNVSVSDYVSLCKPSQWAVGICISKNHPPKATEIQENSIN